MSSNSETIVLPADAKNQISMTMKSFQTNKPGAEKIKFRFPKNKEKSNSFTRISMLEFPHLEHSLSADILLAKQIDELFPNDDNKQSLLVEDSIQLMISMVFLNKSLVKIFDETIDMSTRYW